MPSVGCSGLARKMPLGSPDDLTRSDSIPLALEAGVAAGAPVEHVFPAAPVEHVVAAAAVEVVGAVARDERGVAGSSPDPVAAPGPAASPEFARAHDVRSSPAEHPHH